jgi:NADPH2:quinone reductase
MKAAVYYETGSPDVLRYEDVPDPVCTPDGVIIDVEVVSIEGGDTLARGRGDMPAVPHIVGYQCAGTISEIGAEVTDRSVGQKVVCVDVHGSHAERRAVRAGATWIVPDGLDLRRAACVPIAVGTADDCLFEFGDLAEGETVLVHAGAGALGMAAIQLAKRAGATVLSTASSTEKLERLQDFGLDHGINYVEEDFVARARALTLGKGPDLVVDSVGGQTLVGSIECAAYRGRIITVGDAGRGDVVANPGLLRPANKRLTGVFLGAELFFNQARVHAMIAGHLADLAAGRLEVVVDRAFPLAEAGAAHAYIESRKAFGRVILEP